VSEQRPALVVAVAECDVDQFPATSFTRYAVHTTTEALRLIETARPRIVAIDWDTAQIDGIQVCSLARRFAHTGILVATSEPERVPFALKAGCHAVLLKPFVPNLVAARIGRLQRELPTTVTPRPADAGLRSGTNRVWPHTACPTCGTGGAVSFEFSSYRRMWYACLACEAVWLGPRQE
jgi:DNA-binding response OmpR family regulator